MILIAQGQRWGLAKIHQWSNNGPDLGLVLHSLPCLCGMLVALVIGGLVAETKDYIILPVNQEKQRVSDFNLKRPQEMLAKNIHL